MRDSPGVRLEVGVHQPAALHLYRGAGYVERTPFGAYSHDPLSVFMEEAPDERVRLPGRLIPWKALLWYSSLTRKAKGGKGMSYKPKSLGHLVMRVRDMERSLDFYTRVMGLTVMEKSASGMVFMSANTEKSHELAILAVGEDALGPDRSAVGQAHMAWQMETFEDLQELYDRLKENDVRIRNIGDHGISLGISLGVYLLDPDDNEI